MTTTYPTRRFGATPPARPAPSARDRWRARLVGLAALAGLALVVVGAPAALIAIGATPLPDGIPTWQEVSAKLTGVDDGTMLLTLARLAAWGAWAYLTLGVLLELAARARGIRLPRISGLGLSQGAARALVSAALLTFTTAPSLAAPATAAPAAVVAVVAPYDPADAGPVSTPLAGTDGTQARQSDVGAGQGPAALVHTVRPGETLWGIAQEHLGDGARFLQIAHANYGQPQPDGRTLTTNHRIHPGWQLTIPTTGPTGQPPAGVGDVTAYTVTQGDTLWDIAETHLGEATRHPEIYAASTGITQPGGYHLSDPDHISPGWTLHIPATGTEADTPAGGPTTPTGPVPEPAPDTQQDAPATTDGSENDGPAADAPASGPLPADDHADDQADDGAGVDGAGVDGVEVVVDEASRVRTVGGVGSLLAAGLVGLLASHRAVQSRRRRPGMVLPTPQGESATAGTELAAVADPFSVAVLDTALRTLSVECADAGRALPVLRYARMAAGQVDLHLAEPCEPLGSWTAAHGGSVWSLQVTDTDLLDPEEVAGIPAPYPALVTIGHDPTDAHVLLDLEHATALALHGPEDLTRQVLAALAVELATAGWADDLRITVVTAFPELEDALRTGRIRYLPAVGDLLADLAERARTDHDARTGDGSDDLQHARTHHAAPDTWTPEIVLLATPLTPTQQAQLAVLVEDLPRVAVAVVTTGPGAGPWSLTLTEEATRPGQPAAILDPAGLHLRPQTLDRAGYRAILDILALTATTPDQPYPTGHPTRQLPAPELAAPDPDATDATDAPDDPETGPDLGAQPTAQVIAQPADPPEIEAPDDDPAPIPQDGGSGSVVSGDAAAGVIEASSPELVEPGPAGDPGEPSVFSEDHDGDVHNGGDEHDGDGENDGDDVHDGPAVRAAPFIRLLGPVAMENLAKEVRSRDATSSHELAAFLALHPGATQAAVQEALWPGAPSTSNRNGVTSRLRGVLGERAEDEPYLMKANKNDPLRFLPEVRSDWDLWRDLLPDGPIGAPTVNLEQALALVRGRPFENTPPERYAWADTDRAVMTAQIADAAYELARRRAGAGDWRGAHQIAITGVSIDPALERLWRVRILAAHATDPTAGKDAIERMLTLTAQLGGDLEPETTYMLTALRTGANPRHLLLEEATTP